MPIFRLGTLKSNSESNFLLPHFYAPLPPLPIIPQSSFNQLLRLLCLANRNIYNFHNFLGSKRQPSQFLEDAYLSLSI